MKQMINEIKKELLGRLDVADIYCREVVKENGVTFYGFAIQKDANDAVIPTIYANLDESVEENVERIVRIFNDNCESTPPFDATQISNMFHSKEWVLANIKPCLVNRERNKKLLAKAVHSPYVDLEVVYRIKVANKGDCVGTCILTKDLAHMLDISLSEIRQAAVNNIAKEVEVVSIVQILKQSAIKAGMPEWMVDETFNDSAFSEKMFVITTKDGVNGAGAILCSEATDRLNKLTGGKMYVFPSSRHEMIAVPSSESLDLNDLKDIVTAVNTTELSDEDYLSDSVYLWDNGFMEVVA